MMHNIAKLGKPGSRSLLETIKSTWKETNFVETIRISWRWLDIYFFSKITIEKNILNIHLKEKSLMNHNSKKTANISNTSIRGKSLLIVNLIFLSKSLGNKTCLIPFNSAIRIGLDLVDPFTGNGRFMTRSVNQILSVSLLQNLNFPYHCLLPKRISASLTIGVKLMKRNHNRETRIIMQMSRTCSYQFRTTKRNNMARNAETLRDRIPIAIGFVFNPIPKEQHR